MDTAAIRATRTVVDPSRVPSKRRRGACRSIVRAQRRSSATSKEGSGSGGSAGMVRSGGNGGGDSSSSSAADTARTRRNNDGSHSGGDRRVWTSRIIFLAALAVVAGVISYGGYRLLTDSEDRLAERQYLAIADRALDTAKELTLRKRLGAKSLATSVSYAFPDADAWPFVYMDGFDAVANSVIDTAAAGTMGFAPKVAPAQLPEFVDYVHRVAFDDAAGHPIQPYQTWVTSFDGDLQRYNETDGVPRGWNSTTSDIWPFSMHSYTTDILLFNLHSLAMFGESIDEVQTCVAASRRRAANTNINATVLPQQLDLSECAILSDIVGGVNADGSPKGPSSFIYQPIYPANDPDEVREKHATGPDPIGSSLLLGYREIFISSPLLSFVLT